jgi:hypothetical protein
LNNIKNFAADDRQQVIHYRRTITFARKQPISNNVARDYVFGNDALRSDEGIICTKVSDSKAKQFSANVCIRLPHLKVQIPVHCLPDRSFKKLLRRWHIQMARQMELVQYSSSFCDCACERM